MRIDFGQQMRLQQQMKLSPRMIQSMEILQLPALALEERIDQELEENPVLELAEVEAGTPETVESPESTEPKSSDDAPMVVDGHNGDGEATDDFNRLDTISDQYGDTWSQNTQDSAEFRPARRADGERDAKMDAMSNTAARIEPLSEQLLDQWRFVEVPDAIRVAGERVIAYIDDDGFLRTPLERIASEDPPLKLDDVCAALERLQHEADPPGLAARDVSECLVLQIDAIVREQKAEAGRADPVWLHARRLLTEFREDLEMNRLPRIAKRSGLSIDQINAGVLQLRRLDPAPGRRLSPERAEVIVPDVMVEYDPVHDCYVAALNRGRQPTLRINPVYQQTAADRGGDRTTRKYLKDKIGHARWLIDALEQRSNTLMRVVNVVIDVQRDFLDHGPQHQRPLPMTQVAEQLGVSVGTISRAVQGKYMQTPRGVFPLRQFFSGGTESADGEEMSWAAVQAKLKEIVDDEDPAKPLSDDRLAEALKEKGVDIARRTVAKYRKQLGIPPARRRKRF